MDFRSLFVLNRRMIATTLIGMALFTLLSCFVVLPTPIEGIFFFPSYAVLGFFAALLGPLPGALISLTGMIAVGITKRDFSVSYTIASVICGFIYGLAKKRVRAEEGKFGYDVIIAYNAAQITGNLFSWALAAPLLELFLNPGKPPAEVFLQGITASLMDILSAEFIGTPLLYAYSRVRKRQLRLLAASETSRFKR